MEPLETHAPVREIAVLTDFSRCSSLALQYAGALAAYYNAKMLLVHAIEPRTYGYFPPDSGALDRLRANAGENMRREDTKLCGIRREWLITEGDTSEVVQQVLDLTQIGMIVVGASGAGEPHNDVLGSTAEDIIHQARCPVLCVGPHVVDHDAFPQVGHILLPIDLSSADSKAASYAAALAERHRAHLSLLHVLGGGKPPDSRETEWLKTPYRDRLSAAIHRRLYYPPDTLVEFSDDPVDAILQVARQVPADIIVLGKAPHILTANHRGRKASRTIAQAPCPVIVIPERSGPQDAASHHVPLSAADPVGAALVGN